MPTPKLQIPFIAQSSAQKETTHNTAMNMLDCMVQLVVSGYQNAPPVAPANGDTYLCSGAPTGAWSGHAQEVAYYLSGAWIFFDPREGYLAFDASLNGFRHYEAGAWIPGFGTGNGLTAFIELADTPGVYTGQAGKLVQVNSAETAVEFVAQPYDVSVSLSGKPLAGETVLRYPFPRAVTFPAGLTGSQGSAGVAAAFQTDFAVRKNGVSVGTIRFAAAATTATFLMASPTSFAAGDVLTIVAPDPADATLAHIGLVLAGVR